MSLVLYEAADGVATLSLNDPETRNSLSDELLDGLRDGTGGATPPLDAGGRRREVAGGVGADPR